MGQIDTISVTWIRHKIIGSSSSCHGVIEASEPLFSKEVIMFPSDTSIPISGVVPYVNVHVLGIFAMVVNWKAS